MKQFKQFEELISSSNKANLTEKLSEYCEKLVLD